MITYPQLQRIREGESSPAEARAIIRELLRSDDIEAGPALYTALRAWTWQAMHARRRDDLDDWFSLLRGAGVALQSRDLARSHWIEALSHMVEDSIRHAIAHSFDQLICRSHIGEILQIVQRNNGRISREALADHAGLSSSRLSQVLRDLTAAGALERVTEGKYASFHLTDIGRDLLDKWNTARDRREAAPEEDDSEIFTAPAPKPLKGCKFEEIAMLEPKYSNRDFVPLGFSTMPKEKFSPSRPMPADAFATPSYTYVEGPAEMFVPIHPVVIDRRARENA